MLKSKLRPGAAIAVSAVGLGIATALGRLDAPAPVMASAASSPAQSAEQSAPELDLRELNRQRNPAEVTDLFAPRKPRACGRKGGASATLNSTGSSSFAAGAPEAAA